MGWSLGKRAARRGIVVTLKLWWADEKTAGWRRKLGEKVKA